MTYELYLSCNIDIPSYNNKTFKVASFTQNYDIYDEALKMFFEGNGASVIVVNNYLDVYSNTAYANIESSTHPLERDMVYYMYLSCDGKILAKLQGNIAGAPVVSNLTITRTDTGGALVSGNVTNPIDFEYYVILTQTNHQTQSNLEDIIRHLSFTGNTNPIIEITFIEPYEREQFPFLQHVLPYYAHVYAKNIEDVVSVTSVTLLEDITQPFKIDMGLDNLRCDNMGNIEDPDAIVLDIRFTASHATLKYYALAFSSRTLTFVDYTNHDIYTSMYTVTGNTERVNVSFTMDIDHSNNKFVNDSYVHVAIMLVDKDTLQFSGHANVIELNISLPIIESFSVVPIIPI